MNARFVGISLFIRTRSEGLLPALSYHIRFRHLTVARTQSRMLGGDIELQLYHLLYSLKSIAVSVPHRRKGC